MLAALDHAARGGERGPHFIFPFLMLLLLAFLLTKVVRRRKYGAAGGDWQHPGSPMQTLHDRFARGEIDRAEFEHRKAVLNGDDMIPPAPSQAAPPAPAGAAFVAGTAPSDTSPSDEPSEPNEYPDYDL